MFHLIADWALLEAGFARDVRIGVDGGRIVTVAQSGGAAGDERVAGAVLPGMPNLHSHAFQRSFAGCTEFAGGGGDFWSWRDAMYEAAARMAPEPLAAICAWLSKELLKGGYTSLAEFHYLHLAPDGTRYAPQTAMADALVAGAATAGMALSVLVGVYETGGFGGAKLSERQRRFAQSAETALVTAAELRARHGKDVVVGLALHSLRAVPPASLAIAVHGIAADAPIHIHVSEQAAEVADCRRALGTTPLAWLLDHAPVDGRWCLVHATHATDHERRAATSSGAVVGLCPSTEANLGDGIFNLSPFLGDGGAFGIGSDSNVCLDAFRELCLLEYGQRLRLQRRNVGGAEGHAGRALWQAAAAGGGRACGRRAGGIAVGQHADMVVIEASPETADKAPDFWLDAAIFARPGRAALHVMAGGAWVVRNGMHRDEAAIDARYRAALRRIAA